MWWCELCSGVRLGVGPFLWWSLPGLNIHGCTICRIWQWNCLHLAFVAEASGGPRQYIAWITQNPAPPSPQIPCTWRLESGGKTSQNNKDTPAISGLRPFTRGENIPFFSQVFASKCSGHFVALFRQPEQRLLSSWYDDVDVFRAVNPIVACSENRTVERYLTMEEFTDKRLVLQYFLTIHLRRCNINL